MNIDFIKLDGDRVYIDGVEFARVAADAAPEPARELSSQPPNRFLSTSIYAQPSVRCKPCSMLRRRWI